MMPAGEGNQFLRDLAVTEREITGVFKSHLRRGGGIYRNTFHFAKPQQGAKRISPSAKVIEVEEQLHCRMRLKMTESIALLQSCKISVA